MPKVNKRPRGKNSANLVTLSGSNFVTESHPMKKSSSETQHFVARVFFFICNTTTSVTNGWPPKTLLLPLPLFKNFFFLS
jgi:hypothetical protein